MREGSGAGMAKVGWQQGLAIVFKHRGRTLAGGREGSGKRRASNRTTTLRQRTPNTRWPATIMRSTGRSLLVHVPAHCPPLRTPLLTQLLVPVVGPDVQPRRASAWPRRRSVGQRLWHLPCWPTA